MNELVVIIGWLFIITIFLTVLDFYPRLSSFWFFVTPSYYLLFGILWGLSFLAAYLLKSEVYKDGDLIKVLLLSSLGAFSVIQSFTIQLADWKPVNLSDLISGLKDTVIRETRGKRSKRERASTHKTAKKLSEKEKITEEDLKLEFELLLSQKHSKVQIQQTITQTQNDTQQKGLKLKRLLAHRIAQMDLDRAKQLVKDC
jgi:hypothetical protein